MKDASRLLEDLDNSSCSLQCQDAPNVGGDCDIVWEVVEHHMSAPHERAIGFGISPIDALNDAFSK
ncbi:MAG: hypothetical protein COB12_11975 [Flavobacterium sp.]|nr:MAG: hypothetical protein COB12_11975 [Flavobacterium sp.]